MKNYSLTLLLLAGITFTDSCGWSSHITDDSEVGSKIAHYVPLNTNMHISSELQKQMITAGSDILTKLYNNQDVTDVDCYTSLGINKFVEDSAERRKVGYNPRGEYAPSAYLRSAATWWCNNEETTKKENDIKQYLSRIICVAWALSDQAEKSQQGFINGSFKVIDPNFKLHDFLLDYVRLTTCQADPKTVPTLTSTYNRGYRRDPNAKIIPGSSHYKNFMSESQFGIDIRFETWQTILSLLPAEKAHVLFGKITFDDTQTLPLTFVKFEEVGIGSTLEAGGHTINYKRSLGITDCGRKEKHIPKDITLFYKDFCSHFGEPEHKFAGKSIHHMWQHIESKQSDEFMLVFKSLLQVHFPQDQADEIYSIRTGNEVIVDLRSAL